jgi:hypothetical protein
MHSTYNLNDGYVGSGKLLWRSINKHGLENHVCEILEHYFTREWLSEREAELVCAQTLTDPMCMNLKLGGFGGFDLVNRIDDNVTHSFDHMENMREASRAYYERNPEKHKERMQKMCAVKQQLAGTGILPGTKSFLGKTHTAATKVKMRESHAINGNGVGEKNSQYGKCWIYSINDQVSKKIDKSELVIYLENGWQAGRKLFSKTQ